MTEQSARQGSDLDFAGLAPAVKKLNDEFVKVSIQFVNEAAPILQGVLSFIDHLNAILEEERLYLDCWENEGGAFASTEF